MQDEVLPKSKQLCCLVMCGARGQNCCSRPRSTLQVLVRKLIRYDMLLLWVCNHGEYLVCVCGDHGLSTQAHTASH
jgi:hypothetical protein